MSILRGRPAAGAEASAAVTGGAGVPGEAKVIRCGSYLRHASYCRRYRVAAWSANTPDSSTGNMGLRVARDV